MSNKIVVKARDDDSIVLTQHEDIIVVRPEHREQFIDDYVRIDLEIQKRKISHTVNLVSSTNNPPYPPFHKP